MKLSRDTRESRERAELMGRFMDKCKASGIKVGLRLDKKWDPEQGREVDTLSLTARTLGGVRDPLNIYEPVTGDLRDAILTLGLRIGFRPKLSK